VNEDLSNRVPRGVRAITFDFYNTLAFHRGGSGRGSTLMRWLGDLGLESAPWEHQILYDVFARHGREYRHDLTDEARRRFMERFAVSVFERLEVRASADVARKHADGLWQRLGPTSLAIFPEVQPVLRELRASGLDLAIVSNWQCGLAGFTSELGLDPFVGHVIASAEVGYAKPDPRIFEETCRRLRVQPMEVLHVGDTVVDDVVGARAVGMHAALVRRNGTADEEIPEGTAILADLSEVIGWMRLEP